jgi:hypothetical protein
MTNGDIITANGTFTWNDSMQGWYGDPSQIPWRTTGPFSPQPLSPNQPGIQSPQQNPMDFSDLLQNAQPIGATGEFCDFFEKETIKQLDKIMENDRVYVRSNAPKASEPMPKNSLKVQIHEHPHDWDNSLIIYETNGSSIDDLRHINGLVALLAMMITMSGRDAVLNDKEYMPGDDY